MDTHGSFNGFDFPHLWEKDNREPVFVFTVSIPSGFLGMLFDPTTTITTESHEYGLLMLSLAYWIELLGLLIVSLSIATCVGLVLYKSVIEPKKERTAHAYLIGWGLLLPFWVSWPILLLGTIDLHNAMFRFVVGGFTPVICFFRTTEAIYGICPPHATRSAKDFCCYYANFPIVARVKKIQQLSSAPPKDAASGSTTVAAAIGDPIPCSNSKKLKHLGKFLGLLILTGAFQSILTPHQDMNFFGMGLGDETNEVLWYATERFWTWQLYGNSALQALLFQLILTTYSEAVIFAFSVITGLEAEPAMDNPLLESQSPTEFWGRRWNTVIHTVLKNGIYKPLRKCSVRRDIAVLATFFSSGVFHEWILILVFAMGGGNSFGSYEASYGGTTVFFVWQALLIGLELTLGKTKYVQRVARILPRPLKSLLVVGMGLPLAHLFLRPYVSSFFFEHGAAGLPMVVRVR